MNQHRPDAPLDLDSVEHSFVDLGEPPGQGHDTLSSAGRMEQIAPYAVMMTSPRMSPRDEVPWPQTREMTNAMATNSQQESRSAPDVGPPHTLAIAASLA